MFSTEDYYIRPIEESDLQFLADMRNHPDTWPFLNTLNFVNIPRQKAWLERSSLDHRQMNFVFCNSYQFGPREAHTRLGFVRMDELDTINGSVRVGGDVHPNFRGQGLSKEMYKVIFKFTFDYLRLHRVWLLVADFNIRGINLYKKLGLKEEGIQRETLFRDGKYHNHLVMSILESEYRAQC